MWLPENAITNVQYPYHRALLLKTLPSTIAEVSLFSSMASAFWNLVESFKEIGPIAPHCAINISLYPLTRFVLPKFKSRAFHIWFHIIVGCLLAYILFLETVVYALAVTVLFYFFLDKDPRLCTFLAILTNCAANLYTKLNKDEDGWKYEITCIIMIQFQKIVATTINIYHGRLAKKSGEKNKREFFNKVALEEKPPFLEWFAYMMTPFGACSGPFYEFKLFTVVLELGQREHIKPGSRSRKRANLRWFSALFWDLFNLVFMKYGAITFYERPFYKNQHWIVRSLLCLVCTWIQSCRYFPAWHPCDAANYEAGVGESEFITEFDDISNLGMYDLLTSPSIGGWLQRWNHSAHIFWKRYLFYVLLDAKYPYSIAHHSTFIASALWHGFEPVYFMVLPEMISSTIADEIILKYWPAEKRGIVGNILYHYWKIMAMYNSTSTWWYRSYHAFWYVRRSHDYSMTYLTFAIFVLVEIYAAIFPMRKQKKGEEKQQKKE